MPLNEAQARAVRASDGPAIVLAGPGSGKTLVITRRIRYLVEQRKVPPQHILVITFTRAAAGEMQERFQALMGGKELPVHFGTFHSIFFRILRLAYHYTAGDILKNEQRMQILRDALRRTDWEGEEEEDLLLRLSSEISALKGDLIAPENYYSANCPAEVFRQVRSFYDEALQQLGKIDFDDMMRLTYELLRERKDILQAWQGQFRYILVDEFQDINRLQYEILRMLAAPQDNLFVVGDDDQSIYRFRGAKPEIMLGFPRDYPQAQQILLDVNYRSVPAVVKAAGRLIEKNTARYAKAIRPARTGDLPVEACAYADLGEENDAVIRRIAALHRQGVPYEKIALLYRTNAGPRVMAEQLMRAGIPFQMADVAPNLYDHWITADVVTYMLIAAGSRARGDFLRIINRPKRFIPRSAFPDPEVDLDALRASLSDRDWMADRVDRLKYDIRMLSKMRPWAAVNYIRRGIGYEDYIKEYAEARHLPAEDLLLMLDELQESARPFGTLAAWMEHMQEYTRELEEQRKSAKDAGRREGIRILTMHAAKGLEYTAVFVMDANEGITPHRRAVLDADLEEERRLFYVAVTRARSKLYICWVRERFHREALPSRFIQEMGLEVPKE